MGEKFIMRGFNMLQELLQPITQYILWFVFLYPIAMSTVWSVGAIYFWWLNEKRKSDNRINYNIPLTILVPCYNEAKIIEYSCINLMNLEYPNYNVIFINDGSTDNTSEIIDKYTNLLPYFSKLNLNKNLGKANALNKALELVNSPLVLVLDADSYLDGNSIHHFVKHFAKQPDLGAVTANVLVSDKNCALCKIQSIEFTFIIGLIKRCQQMMGSLFSVSGCATMYNTEALLVSGKFSSNTATDDIDITWRLQRSHYKVVFEPSAKVFIQVPSNIFNYFKQRKRWATGGWHLLKHHIGVFKDTSLKSLWLLYIEFALSAFWSFCLVFATLYNILTLLLNHSFHFSALYGWAAAFISMVFFIQAVVAVFINHRYDKKLKKYFGWICWYPLVFFATGILMIVYTAPKGLFASSNSSGRWNSPKREKNQVFKNKG
jgi:biofilm PGA synthesis N-glycosyltransferase PgaC